MDLFMVMGAFGVLLLLLAFGLNISGRWSETGAKYLTLNIIGSGLAAIYAWAGEHWPFLVLEAVWCVFALYRLAKSSKQKKTPA